MSDLATLRRAYADELRAVAHLRSAAIVRAFATVPREAFLGPGPWEIMTSWEDGSFAYRTTEDADPKHLYRDVLVAIDASRFLNNGLPSALAGWLDSLELQERDHVVHVGCGTGYYSAILAEVVGPHGHVTALELDPGLAERARHNLSSWPQVEVRAADGASYSGTADALFINAGATHPTLDWLRALRTGGRLLVPITASREASEAGAGCMLKVSRQPQGFAAEFLSEVIIFPCIGNRDLRLNELLTSALKSQTWKSVQSVRLDAHEEAGTCWLHGQDVCLSTDPIGQP